MTLFVLKGREPIPSADLHEWASWFETASRHVGKTEVAPGISVSTVFLGIDHNFTGMGEPILFETMVFDDYGEVIRSTFARYSTWDEAETGHARAVEMEKERVNGFAAAAAIQ